MWLRLTLRQSWIYAIHRSLLSKSGDYVTLNIAGFSFFLILGKDDVLRAFHNVCRHRAYEVTRKERGSSTILGCRYHGWSYDTKGQLTKAPEFDKVPGFDKKKNGLWEIHVRVSAQGLVFVNIDAAKVVEDSMLEELDTRTEYWNMSLSTRMAEWRYEGNFNWKLAGEYIH
jgi:phenylpropionate dioxygenase-like ring-hydroxylating dioxygenase large terminal subunit